MNQQYDTQGHLEYIGDDTFTITINRRPNARQSARRRIGLVTGQIWTATLADERGEILAEGRGPSLHTAIGALEANLEETMKLEAYG